MLFLSRNLNKLSKNRNRIISQHKIDVFEQKICLCHNLNNSQFTQPINYIEVNLD